MPTGLRTLLGLTSLLAIVCLFLAAQNAGDVLSPQGCRMSWMSPSYILQTDFDSRWSALASRYSLYLYQEVGWDNKQTGDRLPVLFIPGNAGSSNQVRSIASSAARQYFRAPGHVTEEFASRADLIRPLDVYSVSFNEDLSAFHGSTIQSQIDYTTQAISFILSKYPPGTKITVLGHSMGGIVAASLLPSANVSAVITMSTPFTLPPARFDASIDAIYSRVQKNLAHEDTPVVSLCGGATDTMIPSESCILPPVSTGVFRRTVFSSALEGAWTGVGHEVIVWCHQIRWRVARAALELAPYKTVEDVARVLDVWLRDGHTLPPAISQQPISLPEAKKATAISSTNFVLDKPTSAANGAYRMDLRSRAHEGRLTLTVLLSQGSINSVGPHRPIPLRASVYGCDEQDHCSPLPPTALKLIPNPIPGKPFPVPKQGTDESEGVVLFEAELQNEDALNSVILKIENSTGQGWMAASVSSSVVSQAPAGMLAAIMGGVTVPMPGRTAIKNELHLPNLLSNALAAYRVSVIGNAQEGCAEPLFAPLLVHQSNPDETHYFPLRRDPQARITLHTHLPAPFIPSPHLHPDGIHLTIYSSTSLDSEHPTCNGHIQEIRITLDWPATIARWASRYWMSVLAWAVGVVAFNMCCSVDTKGNIAPLHVSLDRYTYELLPGLSLLTLVLSFLPLPKTRYLGNGGERWLVVIAPFILIISSGLVITSCWLLSFLTYVTRKLSSQQKHSASSGVSKNTVASIALLFLVIFLFVPWQVAFLGCWVVHLHTCATPEAARPKSDIIALEPSSGQSMDHSDSAASLNGYPAARDLEKPEDLAARQNTQNLNQHILLLMTWLLPLVAPILAVWVRTLATAGFTSPFNGDHNFMNVAPFLILVDYASWKPARLFTPAEFERWMPARWMFAGVGAVAFVFGSRNPYVVFNAVTFTVGVLVCTKIGARYLRG